jgi:hypothetical protein
VILEIAKARGIEEGSPSHARLVEWLAKRPRDDLFDTSVASIKVGISVLPDAERQARIGEMVTACRKVAASTGGTKLSRLLGLGHGVSEKERAVAEAIAARLTA